MLDYTSAVESKSMQQQDWLAVAFFMFWAAIEVVMDCKPAAKS